MKELKINVPEGYEIDEDKSTFENIVFKEKIKLPQTLGEYEAGWFNGIVNESEFRYANQALKALYDLRNCYRQGWEPNYKDASGYIFAEITYYKDEIVIEERAYYHSFLSFQDLETAELFLENFRSLIERAKPLLS